jgi:hypothetical protein
MKLNEDGHVFQVGIKMKKLIASHDNQVFQKNYKFSLFVTHKKVYF